MATRSKQRAWSVQRASGLSRRWLRREGSAGLRAAGGGVGGGESSSSSVMRLVAAGGALLLGRGGRGGEGGGRGDDEGGVGRGTPYMVGGCEGRTRSAERGCGGAAEAGARREREETRSSSSSVRLFVDSPLARSLNLEPLVRLQKPTERLRTTMCKVRSRPFELSSLAGFISSFAASTLATAHPQRPGQHPRTLLQALVRCAHPLPPLPALERVPS